MIGMLKHSAQASCSSMLRSTDRASSTDGRTDGRHEEITCVTNKSSRSVTRAHVRDFIILASDKRTLRAATAAREAAEKEREVAPVADVLARHQSEQDETEEMAS